MGDVLTNEPSPYLDTMLLAQGEKSQGFRGRVPRLSNVTVLPAGS